jgi:CheY-like chemotaxis protein
MPKKILLADDSITIQKVVELTFSDSDYEVTAVSNGAKAIQKLGEMKPDIILSDIIMPEKNGYEVCEYVKSHPELRHLPVVLLTGTFEPFDPDRAEKAGCDAVVTKPFESQSLIHRVEELIAQSRQDAPSPAADAEPQQEAAPSPWMGEPEPAGSQSETSDRGETPQTSPEPFTHDEGIFSAPQEPEAMPYMPFETPDESPFAPPPETTDEPTLPPMTFNDLQQMGTSGGDAEPATPESSPWSDEPEPSYSGETRAFPKMTFDDFQQMSSEEPSSEAEWAEPPQLETQQAEAQQAEAPQTDTSSSFADAQESPFGAPPPPEEFSGETRAFPRMTLEELQQMEADQPPARGADDAAAAESWSGQESPAFGGETKAFPKLTFDEMGDISSPSSGQGQPWSDQPEPPAFGEAPAFGATQPETSQSAGAEEPLPWDTTPWSSEAPAETPDAEPSPTPAASAEPMPEDASFAPQPAPSIEEERTLERPWGSRDAADAAAESAEPAVPQSAIAPESAAAPAASADLTEAQIDRIARRVVELMSEQVVRNIAWEVIPDLAEMIVKERVRQLENEA